MYQLSLTNSEYFQLKVALAQDAERSAKMAEQASDPLFRDYWMKETSSTLSLIEKVKDAPYVN